MRWLFGAPSRVCMRAARAFEASLLRGAGSQRGPPAQAARSATAAVLWWRCGEGGSKRGGSGSGTG
jgi:hypothetical protein